jgi:hypothetical protein
MNSFIRNIRCSCLWLGLSLFGSSALCGEQFLTVHISDQGQQPRVDVGPQGTIGIVHSSGETVFYASSEDGGKTFAKPIRVANVPGLMLGRRRGPQVAITRDCVVVTAITKASGNLQSWQSVDKGKTWTGPTVVNDQASAAREGLHSVAAGAENELIAVWLDLRDTKTKIFGSCSKDGGKSWAKNFLIYASPSGSVCECCHPSVASDRKGNVYVMWRNSLQGARDMYLASSRSMAGPFENIQKLGNGTWKLNGCPMDGGGLAIDDEGKAVTVWKRNKTIYSSVGKDEKELGEGKQPEVTMSGDAAYFIWQSGEKLMFGRPNEPVRTLGNGSFPSIVTLADGNLFAVWEGNGISSAVISPKM